MTVAKRIETELLTHYEQGESKALVRLLLQSVTGFDWVTLLANPDWQPTDEQKLRLENIVERLKRYEPIQYILGEADFDGLTFFVQKGVLIPRPETAQLVEIVANCAKSDAHILDIGTGSGCIAVSLAKRLPAALVTAFDVSAAALDVARSNAARHGAKVDFWQVDILQVADYQQRFDLVVSNPPYVLESERATMDENVLRYEPELALFVPDDDPLIFYRKIADFATKHLAVGGRLFFEINHFFARQTAHLLVERGFSEVEIIDDSFDKPRFVSGKFLK